MCLFHFSSQATCLLSLPSFVIVKCSKWLCWAKLCSLESLKMTGRNSFVPMNLKKFSYSMTILGLLFLILYDMSYRYVSILWFSSLCSLLPQLPCFMFSLIHRQAEAKVLKGPHEDLENYLEAIDKLRSNIQFFGSKKSFKSSDGVVSHANGLLAKAISKLEDEFKKLLSSYRFVFLCLMLFIFRYIWWKVHLLAWTQ